MRTWVAIALLAGSWLFGLGLYEPPRLAVWLGLLVLATILLARFPLRLPPRPQRWVAAIALLPAAWWIAVPHKVIPLLLIFGLVLSIAPMARMWPRAVGRGALAAGLILLVQALVLEGYQAATARNHVVPNVAAWPTLGVLRLVGTDVARDGEWLVVGTTHGAERIAATWDLLWDPASVLFLVGSLSVLVLRNRRGRRQLANTLSPTAGWLLLTALVWCPLRAALLIAVVAHQVMLADAILFPNVGRILVSSWVHLLLLAPWLAAAALAGQLGHRRPETDPTRLMHHPAPANRAIRPLAGASLMVISGLALLATSWYWTPAGSPRQGRVLVVERHSTWEPTTEPYGTRVYGEAGSYNYAAAYAYCNQFYQMGRILESEAISDETLGACDVLIIKTPTARYSEDEVDAVVRFVKRGGATLLIGDHTNVFNMNTYLNDIGRRLGFTFRNDLLFCVDSPYRQAYQVPRMPHPIVMHIPPMNFAVSCSIDPGRSFGQMAIRNTGLFSLPPAYQESNYHPQAEYRPYLQYGAWCQLWASTYGRGRVAAFADSTLFSNFCVFQPGKKELLTGMLEWLNRTSSWDRLPLRLTLRSVLILLGAALVWAGFYHVRRRRGARLVLVALGICSWCVTAFAAGTIARHRLPYPTAIHHPMQHVVIDRTLSRVPLFTGAFADDQEGFGYGLLEQWIPRIGCYISRQSGAAAFSGHGLVVICPTQSPAPEFRAALVQWVRAGGNLVIFDTPDLEGSTANSLLMLFDMQSSRLPDEATEGPLRIPGFDQEVDLRNSCVIEGGDAIAEWNGEVVAARQAVGMGTVTAIGFGSLFNDAAMGFHWLVEPDPATLLRYDALYSLLRTGLQPEPAAPLP